MPFLSGWAKRKEIRYGSSIPTANLSDYPKRFWIATDADIAAELASGGGIAITEANGNTLVPFGLYPSTNLAAGTVRIRAKFDLVSTATAGDVIGYIYYDSTKTTSEDKSAVLNGIALFVPCEDTDLSSGIFDWAAETTIGTDNSSAPGATGTVGSALEFTGGAFDLGSIPALDSQGDLSVEFIAKIPETQVQFARILEKGANDEWTIALNDDGVQDGRLWFIPRNLSLNSEAIVTTDPVNDDTWHSFGFVINSGTPFHGIYVDGTLEASDTVSGVTASDGTEAVYLASFGGAGTRGEFTIDELMIHTVARSAGWFAYTHQDNFNHANTFTLGTEEENSGISESTATATLTLPAITLASDTSYADSTTLADDLVLVWHMDETDQATRIDSIGTLDLTVDAGADDMVGAHGNALRLGLVGQSTAGTDIFTPIGSWTMFCLLWIDSSANERSNEIDVDGQWGLWWGEPTVGAFPGAAARFNWTGAIGDIETALEYDTWNRVVIRYNDAGNERAIWSDNGAKTTILTSSTPYTGGDPYVANIGVTQLDDLTGLDEVHFWHRALSDAEVESLLSGTAGIYPFVPPVDVTASLNIAAMTLAAVVDVENPVAAASLTLGAVTLAAEAAFTEPSYDADASLPIAAMTLTAEAAHDDPDFTATATMSLAAMTLTSDILTESPLFNAEASLTLAAMTLTAEASHEPPTYDVEASLTVAAMTLTADVQVLNPVAEADLTIAAITLLAMSSTPGPNYTADASMTLGAMTLTAEAGNIPTTYPVAGDLIIPAMTLAAAGLQGDPIDSAVAALTLPAFILDAIGCQFYVTYTSEGRSGIGVAQPQSGTDYPLVKPSADIRYLLADFHLAYDDPSDYADEEPFQQPFKIAWLFGAGCLNCDVPDWAPSPTHHLDLLVTDADGRTVFDSTLAVNQPDEDLPNYQPYGYYDDKFWGDRLRIYEWRTGTAVCRAVLHTTWPDDEEPAPRDYCAHLVPDNAVLDPRTIYRMPKRVRSLRVLGTDLTRTPVELRAGYNVLWEDLGQLENDDLRMVQGVRISATPGAGLGIYPGCTEPELFVTSINGVQPGPGGELLLQVGGCYNLYTPTTLVSESPRRTSAAYRSDNNATNLKLTNSCDPCCSCDDYVDTGLYLNRLRDEYVRLKEAFELSRDRYHNNRERWNTAKDCYSRYPLRLSLQPQGCPFLDVAAQFCNQDDDCQHDVALIMRFRTLPEIDPSCDCAADCDDPVPAPLSGGDEPLVQVVCGHTFIKTSTPRLTKRYTLDGQWCEYRAYWDVVGPFEAVDVRFRLQFPNAGLGDQNGSPTAYAVTGCLYGTIGGARLCLPNGEIAVDTKTVTLSCPQESC